MIVADIPWYSYLFALPTFGLWYVPVKDTSTGA
jgi:hypothetical protein